MGNKSLSPKHLHISKQSMSLPIPVVPSFVRQLPGKSPSVLLVHGFPLSGDMWQPLAMALSPRWRVILPDLPGFGKSGCPAEQITMEEYADGLATMLDGLGESEPVVFCGLSMGGYIGWQFALRHRDRLKALIMCDTRAVADTEAGAAARRAMAAEVKAKGLQFVADAMLPKLLAAGIETRRPDVFQRVQGMILATSRTGVAAAQRGMALRPNVVENLPQIDVPTLILVGEHDALATPDEMRGIAEKIPGSKFVVISGAAHIPPLENATDTNQAVIEFLSNLI
jgi:pimeloyl-ACP methyl ester carboxylesterase